MMRILRITLVVGLVCAGAAGAQQVGNFCVADFVQPANCTANDVRFEAFTPVAVIEDCVSGTPGEAEMIFDALISAFGSPDRYDIAGFISLDEDLAIDGDNCLHDYLAPPLTESPTYGDDNGDGIPDIKNGPWWDGDNGTVDMCGDMETNTQVIKTLQQVRFLCVDRNMNGEADISACASWGNNQSNGGGEVCVTINDAFPGTPSKCSCTILDVGIPVPVELESFTIER